VLYEALLAHAVRDLRMTCKTVISDEGVGAGKRAAADGVVIAGGALRYDPAYGDRRNENR
jgi:hypothetical protein